MTVTEVFLTKLPRDVADKAIANHRAMGWADYGEEDFNDQEPSLGNALVHAFWWIDSPEGHKFWSDIYHAEARKNANKV